MLLSMNDLVDNSLGMPLQEQYVSSVKRRHRLRMEIYFLIDRWKPDDLDFVIYILKELKTLHRTSGHLSVKELGMILCRADGPSFDTKAVRSLGKIREDCRIRAEFSSAPRHLNLPSA